jgi:2,6-dihydroxypyridine 3-monooxygenase
MTPARPGERRAIVVGGSLAGLSAVFFLRRAGFSVEVFERSPVAMRGQGAGIVLNPATVRHLDGDQRALDGISVPSRWLRYMDEAGAVIGERVSPLRFASYDALYRSYLARSDEGSYHLGREVVGANQSEGGVVARLASGSEHEADLLVWADGIRSTGRRRLLPDVARTYVGYVAWRGTVAPDQLSASTRDAYRDAITYHVGRRTHLLAYPIRGGSGETMVNWLWYRNVDEVSLPALLTASDGAPGEVSVAPGRVAEPVVSELRIAATALPAPMLDLVEATDRPFPQAVFDVSAPRMAFGRECLVGDAGFVVRPHTAAGAAKATEDGYRLGRSLSMHGDVVTALAEWEPRQLELGRALIHRNRVAGERLQATGTWRAGEPLPFGLHRQGDSEMPDAAAQPGGSGPSTVPTGKGASC